MSTKLLTNLLFEPKGVHDPALTYSIKDTVMSPDGSKVYFALRDVPSGIALTDENYWMLQIDLSGSKNAMDEAVAAFADYAKIVGTRVKGETAKASGNPVSFLPDAESLLQPVTVLEPQQEGSGDPYPMGGGRNKLPNIATTKTINGVTFTVNADGSVKVNGTATADADFNVLNSPGSVDAAIPAGSYIMSGSNAGTSSVLVLCGYGNSQLSYAQTDEVALDAPNGIAWVVLRVSSGKTVDFVFYPMIRLASDPDSTYAPYSNIRPFIGYDKLDLNHAGNNLANSAPSQSITTSGITFSASADGHGTNVKGTSSANWAQNLREYYDTLTLPPGTYTFSRYLVGSTNGANVNFMIYVNGKNDGAVGSASKTYTFAEHTDIGFFVYVAESGKTVDCTVYLQLELDTVSSDFQPYIAPTLHTVQIGQTVYGFRYEWLTGKAWIEWAMVTFDGSEDWKIDGDLFYLPFNNLVKTSNYSEVIKCSHFVTSINQAFIDLSIGGISGYYNPDVEYPGKNLIYAKFSGADTVEKHKAYIAAQKAAGTPVQVCWKLAQPIEIQLTPHIISAVDPEQTNTLYGDGTIEVEYVKPLHVSIEERVAAALAAAAQTE